MRVVRLLSLVAVGACVALMATTAAAFEVIGGSGVAPAAELPPAPLANSEETIFNTASMADLKRQLDEAFAASAGKWTNEQLTAFTEGAAAEFGGLSGAEFVSSPLLSVNGLTAPATAGLSTSFFNRILAQIAKIINDTGRSIVIPGGSEKKFGYDAIRFSQFSVNSITVSTAIPNKITVRINGLTIAIGNTNFWVKALIKCKGHFSASIQGATVAVTLALNNDGNGHLRSTTTVAASIQKVAISHKFNSVLCKVANALISLFIGNIDKKISAAIKDQLPKMLGPAISQAVDKMFLNIPLYFVNTPSVVPQGFSVTVDLLGTVRSFYTDANGRVPADPMAAITEGLEGYDRDVTVSVPAASMNNIMIVAFNQGKFTYSLLVNGNTSLFRAIMPNAYDACPACRLVMGFDIGTPPYVVIANNDLDSVVRGITLSFAGRDPSGRNVPLFVMGANISADLDGLTMRTVNGLSNLYFQVGMKTLDLATKSSSVGPLPALDIISPVVTFCVQSLAIPAFNAQFTGFDFPPMFNNAYVKALAGVFEFGTNLNIQLQ